MKDRPDSGDRGNTPVSFTLSRDAIKLAAIAAMTLNHIGHTFALPFLLKEVFIDIGYFTAVTMCYFLVEGFSYTRSVRNYAIRLFVFALLAQWPFMQLVGSAGNMLFSILLCLGILIVQEYVPEGCLKRILTPLLIFGQAFTDWPALAAVFTLLFYWAKKKNDGQWKPWIACFIGFFVMQFITFLSKGSIGPAAVRSLFSALPVLLSGVVIRYLYNGKRAAHGRGFFKWFFYAYYPLHLWILYALTIAG